jgi:hypothetical protein
MEFYEFAGLRNWVDFIGFRRNWNWILTGWEGLNFFQKKF